MNDQAGTLILDEKTVKAKYLLLRYKGKAEHVYKISSKGPKVYSKLKLNLMKYPNPKNKEYLVIEIAKTKTFELGSSPWDYSKLDEYKNPMVRVGIPFTVSLSELMQVKQND